MTLNLEELKHGDFMIPAWSLIFQLLILIQAKTLLTLEKSTNLDSQGILMGKSTSQYL